MSTNEHVKVLEQMRASGFDFDFGNEQYAALDAAIAALKAEKPSVWRCTKVYFEGDGGLTPVTKYVKSEADMMILRDSGFACELLESANG